MSDSGARYYYEIALTNRQVLVSFVILLGCVLLAFGAGVWVGRMGQGQVLAAELPDAAASEESSDLASLQEFQFPSDEAAGRLRKPDLSRLRSDPPPPSRDTTLAEDVGSASRPAAAGATAAAPATGDRPSAPPSQPATQAPPPSPAARVPAPAPPPSPPPAQVPAPASAADAAPVPKAEGFVVQVFATREEAQAQKVRDQLRAAGYEAFISSVQVGSLNNYRVRVGPYSSRQPAERAAREITAAFKLETWVTAAGPPSSG